MSWWQSKCHDNIMGERALSVMRWQSGVVITTRCHMSSTWNHTSTLVITTFLMSWWQCDWHLTDDMMRRQQAIQSLLILSDLFTLQQYKDMVETFSKIYEQENYEDYIVKYYLIIGIAKVTSFWHVSYWHLWCHMRYLNLYRDVQSMLSKRRINNSSRKFWNRLWRTKIRTCIWQLLMLYFTSSNHTLSRWNFSEFSVNFLENIRGNFAEIYSWSCRFWRIYSRWCWRFWGQKVPRRICNYTSWL